jgi:hypothetical protein
MSRRSNAFAVAVLDLPSWADYTALPPGTFREFTLNSPADVGMQRAALSNWTGGTFVPDYGARGAACYHGGGEHNTWTDSRADGGLGQQGVFVLDCDTRLYSRKCYPVTNHSGVRMPVPNPASGGPTDNWGAYQDDGSPQSKHTYNCCSYMPAAWGGGSHGSFMRVAHTGGPSTSRYTGVAETIGYSATWRFDLSKSNHSVADPSIHKLTGSSLYNFGGGAGATINDAPTACIDTTREGWWATSRAGHGWGNRMVFTSKTGVISPPIGQDFGTFWSAMHHLADDDIIVRIFDNSYAFGVSPNWVIAVWQTNTANNWVLPPVSRQSITDTFPPVENNIPGYPYVGEMHPRWSTILGCFVGLDCRYPVGGQPTSTIRVWKFTPPPVGQRFTSAWQITWELVTAVAGSPTNVMHMINGENETDGRDGATVNGVWGRLVECPSLRAFVWTRDVNKPGQLVRLRGM